MRNQTVKTLRAFIAYLETGNAPGNHFQLIPQGDAVAAGIPCPATFEHEGETFGVFICGDVEPLDVIRLERAGVINS